jgi:hypothetical protein
MAFNQFPQKGGIPSGNTAARPSSPAIGDTYYNGQKGFLEIYNGTTWLVASAVPGAPSIAVTDIGTSRAFDSGQASIAITAPTNGGAADSYVITASNTTNSYTTSSTTATTVTLTVGNGGSYDVSAYAINGFGNSASFNSAPSITTVPQTPVISANTSTLTTITVAVSGESGGKAITNYQYSFDGTTYTAFSPAQTGSTITLSGLTAASVYTIRLKAVNANGVSVASNALTTGTAWTYDYVVVGGGAGGTGYYYTGGGGAGAMRTGTLDGATSVAYTVTVGAGGAQQNGPGGDGNPGASSVLGTITAAGGRGAAASAPLTSFAGGTIATSSQGGGQGGPGNDVNGSAGGGGGAGAAGTSGNSSGTIGGNGGVGLSTSISGSSVFYAGGGGGSAYSNTRGTGGNGGGGNGTKGTNGQVLGSAGTANTGGGGGGASHPANGADYGYGWAGGSGRVMIKIPNTFTATFSGGATTSLSTSVTGFKVYTVTAAGTSDTVTFG